MSSINFSSLDLQDYAVDNRKVADRRYFDISKQTCKVPLLYMLTLAAAGLLFYPALLLLPIFWIKAYKNDRYNLLIQITLFVGGYGSISYNYLGVWQSDIMLLVCIALWFLYRKPPILKKTLLLTLLYFGLVFLIATASLESMRIQIYNMRQYWSILYIIFPFALFSGKEFNIDTFYNKVAPYAFITMAFYICDGFIVPGNLLMPVTAIFGDDPISKFWSPYILPLGSSLRKYPPGLYILVLITLPVIKNYRLRWWQWVLFIGAMAACRTMTILSAFFMCWLLFQGSFKRFVKVSVLGIFLLVGLYVLDMYLPTYTNEYGITTSTLRIHSTVEQFVALQEAADDEDLATFASGRMAQILPKVAIIEEEGRQLTGLGFLHKDKTTIGRYVLDNEYYADVTQAEEVATAVEVIPVQVYLNIGWLGLLIHVLFFLALYFLIRKIPHSSYYLSVIFMLSWFGLGGFAGLVSFDGLALAAIAFAAPILNDREHLPGFLTPWTKGRIEMPEHYY